MIEQSVPTDKVMVRKTVRRRSAVYPAVRFQECLCSSAMGGIRHNKFSCNIVSFFCLSKIFSLVGPKIFLGENLLVYETCKILPRDFSLQMKQVGPAQESNSILKCILTDLTCPDLISPDLTIPELNCSNLTCPD